MAVLGQLPNAPLIYVLAQIAFTRIPKMESRWEDFHEEIFDLYPHAEVERIHELQLQNEKEPITADLTRWNMFDKEKYSGVILAPDSIILHASSYTTSEDFFKKLKYILDKLSSILPDNVAVKRLGLRYIDLLLPEEKLPVEDQVSGKLGSISLESIGCQFQKLEEVTRYKTEMNSNLVVRHRQSTEPDILPGDLFPNKLRLAGRLEKVKPKGVVGLMDYDHYIQFEENFNISSIIDKFKSLHDINSKAFKLTTSDDAEQLWNKD